MILTRASTALFFTCFFLISQAFSTSSDDAGLSTDGREEKPPCYSSLVVNKREPVPPYLFQGDEEELSEENLSDGEASERNTAVNISPIPAPVPNENRPAIPDTPPYPTSKSLWGKFLRGYFYGTGCCGENANDKTQAEIQAIAEREDLYQEQHLTPPISLVVKRGGLILNLVGPNTRKKLRTDRTRRGIYASYIALKSAEAYILLSLLYQAEILSCEERAAKGITQCTDTAENILTASKVLVWGHVATNIAATGLPLRYFWNGVSKLPYHGQQSVLGLDEYYIKVANYMKFMATIGVPFNTEMALEVSHQVLNEVLILFFRKEVKDTAFMHIARLIFWATSNAALQTIYLGSKYVANAACGKDIGLSLED